MVLSIKQPEFGKSLVHLTLLNLIIQLCLKRLPPLF